MGVEVAAIAFSWIAIVILTGAVAACVRALRFQEARLLQVLGQPRRLHPGDALTLPRSLAQRIPSGDSALLLFGTAECASCKDALGILARRLGTTGALPLVALFRGAAPPVDEPQVTVFEHQAEAFEDLNIGLLPFAVLLSDGEVIAAGAVGSNESVDELWKAVERFSVHVRMEAGTHG